MGLCYDIYHIYTVYTISKTFELLRCIIYPSDMHRCIENIDVSIQYIKNIDVHTDEQTSRHALINFPYNSESEYIHFIDLEMSPKLRCRLLAKINKESLNISLHNVNLHIDYLIIYFSCRVFLSRDSLTHFSYYFSAFL